jgi:hypothetical protein
MGSYFDLPGIIDVQKNYLVDLSKNYYNNPITVAIGVDDLQKGLTNISNSYVRADKSSSAVLTEQQRMKDIVQKEQDRLNDKQNLIMQMEQENKRKTLLNDTYRKKKVQYSKMMIVIIVALCIFIVITLIGRFTGLSGGFLNIFYILDISITAIVCFNLYTDLAMRDNINYDQIYIPPPNVDASGNLITDNTKSIWSEMRFGCYESACCADDTVFDPKLKVCIRPGQKDKSSPAGPIVFSSSTPVPMSTLPMSTLPMSTSPMTPSPMTPSPMTPSPMTPSPMTPSPMTPSPMTPSPMTPSPMTPSPMSQVPVISLNPGASNTGPGKQPAGSSNTGPGKELAGSSNTGPGKELAGSLNSGQGREPAGSLNTGQGREPAGSLNTGQGRQSAGSSNNNSILVQPFTTLSDSNVPILKSYEQNPFKTKTNATPNYAV